jgi:aldehyde:ferredoxin oxidoreductase
MGADAIEAIAVPAARIVKPKKRCCKSRPRCKRCPVVCRRLTKLALAEKLPDGRYLLSVDVTKKRYKHARS